MTYTSTLEKINAPRKSGAISAIPLPVPPAYQVILRRRKGWLGRSKDGKQHLLVQRLAVAQRRIPTFLRDSEFGLLLCSIEEAERLTPHLQCIEVAGKLAETHCKGFMAMVEGEHGRHYLLALLSERPSDDYGGLCREIVGIALKLQKGQGGGQKPPRKLEKRPVDSYSGQIDDLLPAEDYQLEPIH